MKAKSHFIRVGRKRYKAWIDRDPLPEELLKQFAPAIQAQINQYNGYLPSREDREDIWQDITIGVLQIPSPHNRGVDYVLQTIRNVAIKAIRRFVGLSQSKHSTLSNQQLTDPLESPNGYNPEVERAASTEFDPVTEMSVVEVRKLLTEPALSIFDWVLDECGSRVSGEPEHFSVNVVNRYCKDLGYSKDEIRSIRREIVECLHACGLLMNYPSPDCLKRHRLARHLWEEK